MGLTPVTNLRPLRVWWPLEPRVVASAGLSEQAERGAWRDLSGGSWGA